MYVLQPTDKPSIEYKYSIVAYTTHTYRLRGVNSSSQSNFKPARATVKMPGHPIGHLALHAVILIAVSVHHANLVHALGGSAELCSAAVPNVTAGKLCAPAVTVLGMPKSASSGDLSCSACGGTKGLARRVSPCACPMCERATALMYFLREHPKLRLLHNNKEACPPKGGDFPHIVRFLQVDPDPEVKPLPPGPKPSR